MRGFELGSPQCELFVGSALFRKSLAELQPPLRPFDLAAGTSGQTFVGELLVGDGDFTVRIGGDRQTAIEHRRFESLDRSDLVLPDLQLALPVSYVLVEECVKTASWSADSR